MDSNSHPHFSWHRPSGILKTLIFVLAVVLGRSIAGAQGDGKDARALLWSSTGGGWRAMFSDVAFANLFQQAGLMDQTSTKFNAVSTVSGASWFSTQLFYSQQFYDRTVLAQTPEELESFVLQWIQTYYSKVSTVLDNETIAECDMSDVTSPVLRLYSGEHDPLEIMSEICELAKEFDLDWTKFVHVMLEAASTNYSDPGFVDTIANSENRIEPMKQTNLLIQTALMPNSRIRENNNTESTAVYVGYDTDEDGMSSPQLFTVALSAAWVVGNNSADFWYGTDDKTDQLKTYTAPTPVEHSWDTFESFFLYPGNGGKISINGSDILAKSGGDQNDAFVGKPLRPPFGGPEATTVAHVASASSAAAGGRSPLAPSVYNQSFSISFYSIEGSKVRLIWRVLLGISVGLVTTVLVGWLVEYCARCRKKKSDGDSNNDTKEPSNVESNGQDENGQSVDVNTSSVRKPAIASGVCCGILAGCLAGLYFGFGSILLPTVYDVGVGLAYENPHFDKFAVCSQWPNPCGTQDAQFNDGYYIDNPAVVVNVGYYLQENGVDSNQTIKLIVTNTNDEWDNDYNLGQILHFFNTTFNEGVEPGEFLWGPDLQAPYRSPQIFEEYLDKEELNNSLVPLPDSNMTTATFSVTTLDNPSFGVLAGQPVDILLLNVNAGITTLIVGRTAIDTTTQSLLDMTLGVAFNEELLKRVKDFTNGAD